MQSLFPGVSNRQNGSAMSGSEKYYLGVLYFHFHAELFSIGAGLMQCYLLILSPEYSTEGTVQKGAWKVTPGRALWCVLIFQRQTKVAISTFMRLMCKPGALWLQACGYSESYDPDTTLFSLYIGA